jgi:hypothetical protein
VGKADEHAEHFGRQLFGLHDSWAGSGIVVQRPAKLEALLAPFEVERLHELDQDGTTPFGERKHWNVYHVVARKRQYGTPVTSQAITNASAIIPAASSTSPA